MSKYFEVKGDSAERKFENCPKCGPGYFMGAHKDRSHCGVCGYTKFKGKGKGKK